MSIRCQRRIVSGVNRRHLDQDLATETGAEDRQPPPFVVGENHTLAAELSLQDSVLSRRYSMISPCPRWNQPMRNATSSCIGTTRRVYVTSRASFRTQRAAQRPSVHSELESALGSRPFVALSSYQAPSLSASRDDPFH
jgi:hypothetical protein